MDKAHSRVAAGLAALSALWCVAICVVIWRQPSFWRASLDGPLPLFIPIALAGAGAAAAWARSSVGLSVAAALVLAFVFLAQFSIGGYYIPAGCGLLLAALFLADASDVVLACAGCGRAVVPGPSVCPNCGAALAAADRTEV